MRTASPSWLDVAEGGCRARLAAYEAHEEPPPDDALADGIAFHRGVEAIQRAILRGAPARDAVDAVLNEAGANTWLRGAVALWEMAGWTDVSACLGVEMGLAIDAEGEAVSFRDPSAWVHGILDRIDVRDDPDLGMRLLEVTDWKGWSGWKRWQPEVYALCALAWARHKGMDVDGVRVSVWSYRPTSEESRLFKAGDEEQLREAVAQVVRSAHALARRPPEETRPADGCAMCPRLLHCPAVREVMTAPVPPFPTSLVEAQDMARRLGAAEALAAALKDGLKGWVEEHGPVSGGDHAWGPKTTDGRNIHAPAFWRDVVDHVAPLLGEGASVGDLAARLAQVAPIGVTAAEKAARQLAPRDREGQQAFMDDWARLKLTRSIGWQ